MKLVEKVSKEDLKLALKQKIEAQKVIDNHFKYLNQEPLRKCKNLMTWGEAIKKYNLKEGEYVKLNMRQVGPPNLKGDKTWILATDLDDGYFYVYIQSIDEKHKTITLTNGVWWPLDCLTDVQQIFRDGEWKYVDR